jgi:cytochrome c551/c552
MKNKIQTAFIFLIVMSFASCMPSDKKKETNTTVEETKVAPVEEVEAEAPKAEETGIVDLSNKGIGPIKSVTIPATIDASLVAKGKTVFDNMCTACHKIDKKFVGPNLQGITKRRSTEWIMNMIMNPEEMIQKDPIAKQLMVESNMAVMANQSITEADARALVEYFRQNDTAK